jgi:hypothetical protein
MPLQRAHIEASDRLWNRLEDLRRSDRALAALQGSLPTFDPESTLLKVLALHPFDTSKTHCGQPLAREIGELLRGVDGRRCGIEVVESLAAIADRHGKSSYDGLGFASRFAHHFLDSERFPVLDAWSERALQALLGGELLGSAGDGRYTRFARSFAHVAFPLALDRRRRLVRWLWLAGQCTAWRANRRTAINRAVRELFEAAPEELARLLPPELRVAVAARDDTAPPTSALEPPPALPSRPDSGAQLVPDFRPAPDLAQ